MKHSDLLNEVIADAKAVRETAVQTAISRLRESFEPTVRNLISQRLREEDEIEDDDVEMKTPEPEMEPEPAPEMEPEPEPEPVEEELDFDADDYTDDTYEDDDIFEEDYLDNGEDDEEFLAQILSELDQESDDYGDEMTEMEEMDDEMTEMEEMDDADISEEDLDEMISELEQSMAADEMEDPEKPEMPMENRRQRGKRIRENWTTNWGADEYDSSNDFVNNNQISENRRLKTKLRRTQSQLREAYKAIQAQKTAINEVNLLNSKLLFLTKITSKHQMTPDMQIKILEAFDRAKTVREVKLIYATIAESLSKTKSKGIMESASRPARAVKKSLNENQFVFASRWKQLAGIS